MSAVSGRLLSGAGRFAGRAGLALVVPLLLVAFWQRGVQSEWVLPFDIKMGFLPKPWDVAKLLWDFAFGGVYHDAYSGALWHHLGESLLRVLAGFGLSVLFAVPLGVVMGYYSLAHRMLDLTVNLVRPVPATAWVPLVLLVIGFGSQATIFLIMLSSFFPILLNTTGAVREVPPRLVEAAQMLGTSPGSILAKVVVPAAMPGIVSGLRLGLGLSWVILVLGEANGVEWGLGAMITLARELVRTDVIVVGMIVIGLAGLLTDRILLGAFRLALGRRPMIRKGA